MKTKISKKEKKIFWAGISLGVGGGIIGSLFGSLVVELLSRVKNSGIYLWILFIPTTIMLVWLMAMINKTNRAINEK